MRKTDYIYIGYLFLLTLGIGALFFNTEKKQKLAYVRNEVILTKYKGMQDAFKEIEERVIVMQSNLDSLSKNYNTRAKSYHDSKGRLTKKEQGVTEESLRRDQRDILKYKDQLEQGIQRRREELSVSTINQINEFIETYGKEKGYDYILGVTDNGSLLYATDQDDLTDIILIEINKRYLNK